MTPRYVVFGGPGAAYAVAAEDGDPDGAGGAVLIGFLDADDGWEDVRARLATRQGYLGSRLYRGEDRVVAVVRWSSPLMYARALREPEIAEAIGALPGAPALYLRT